MNTLHLFFLLIITISISTSSFNKKGKLAEYIKSMQSRIPDLEKEVNKTVPGEKSEIKLIVGQGYTKYYQSTTVTFYENIAKEDLEEFFDFIGDTVNMPSKYTTTYWRKLAKTVKNGELSGVNCFNTIFDQARSDNKCGFIDVIVENLNNGMYNVLISEVDSTFNLAKDLYVSYNTKSVLYGLIKHTKVDYVVKDKLLTTAQFEKLINFFTISITRRQVDTLQLGN